MKPLQPIRPITDSILYEDNHILLCHKPAGLPVQTKKLQEKDLESLLKNYLAQKKSANPYLAVINRLDQPVEGLILFAKTKDAAARLTKQLTQNRIYKKYLAITSAPVSPEKGTLQDYLLKDQKQNCSNVVTSDTAGSRLSVLDYEVLSTTEHHSLVDISLKTGRHHQIRVQFSHAHAPLLGDKKYCGEPAEQLCLCSYFLSFFHPKNEKKMTFCVPPHNPEFQVFAHEVNSHILESKTII